MQGAVQVELEIRSAKFGSIAAPLGTAKEGDVLAALEGLLQVGLIEPDGLDGVAAIGEDRLGEVETPGRRLTRFDLLNAGDDVDLLAGANVGHGNEVGAVQVLAGEVVKTVFIGGDV